MYELGEEARLTIGMAGVSVLQPGANVTVKAKHLGGSYLTLYDADGGSSLGTSTVTDANGRIDGNGNGVWVKAPDYDLEFWDGADLLYTQKVRVSPPGTFHV